MFTITPQVWNGTSEKLTKRRSYHPTTPLTNDQQADYISKAKGQDKNVLAELKLGRGTPREIYARMNSQGKAILLTSVRRSLDSLGNLGMAKKVDMVTNDLGRPETVWEHAH